MIVHPRLPAIPCYLFKDTDLQHSLIATSDLCDIGCTIVSTAKETSITHPTLTDPIYRITADATSRLLHITPTPMRPPAGLNLTIHHQLNVDYVAYAAATLGNPHTSTLIHALQKGYLHNFPRLTADMVRRNPPNSLASAKGHLSQHKAGMRSTKATKARGTTKPKPLQHRDDLPSLPPATSEGDRTTNLTTHEALTHEETSHSAIDPTETPESIHELHSAITSITDDTLHADLTGRFPVPSRHGHSYLLVSTLAGYIHMEPVSSRQAAAYTAAVQRTIEFFALHEYKKSSLRMDNETNETLEQYLRAQSISVQYVPPHNHRANRAERAIRTAKNHIVASICSAPIHCPLSLWTDFLPQMELTLNTLRPYAPNPNIFAYHGIHKAPFDFLAHPIATRASWAPHGTGGFYMGPALQHYRCYRIYIPQSTSERITDSVAWFPTPHYVPGSTTPELVLSTLADVRHALDTTHATGESHTDTLASMSSALTTLKNLLTRLQEPRTAPYILPPLPIPTVPETTPPSSPTAILLSTHDASNTPTTPPKLTVNPSQPTILIFQYPFPCQCTFYVKH